MMPVPDFAKRFFLPLFLLLMTLVATALLSSCSRDKEPIRIGFIGTLSGKYADIGNDALIGVRIAFNEINQAGGIEGRTIELVIEDDSGTAKGAIAGAEKLTAAGIKTVIGPNLSTAAVKLVPWCNEHDVLLICPTVSTSTLAGLDDALIRVFPHNEPAAGEVVATFIDRAISPKQGVILYDSGNAAYTRDIVQYAENALAEEGIPVIAYPFRADEGFNYGAMVEAILTPEDGFIYIVAAALDTAMFSWQIKKQQWTPQLIFNHWAISDELYRIGGEAIDGALFLTSHFPVEASPGLLDFQKKVAEHTTRTAYKFMIYGYEAAQVVFAGLKRDPNQLKQAILDQGTYQGLQYAFSIDRWGDVKRPYYAIEIEDGEAVPFVLPAAPQPGQDKQ